MTTGHNHVMGGLAVGRQRLVVVRQRLVVVRQRLAVARQRLAVVRQRLVVVRQRLAGDAGTPGRAFGEDDPLPTGDAPENCRLTCQ
ncbi:MAG: hypothetical protein HY048_01605 [Acidobacteria bacterium]|nr:hypothetical protein [Acidobacteriota bacterium]